MTNHGLATAFRCRRRPCRCTPRYLPPTPLTFMRRTVAVLPHRVAIQYASAVISPLPSHHSWYSSFVPYSRLTMPTMPGTCFMVALIYAGYTTAAYLRCWSVALLPHAVNIGLLTFPTSLPAGSPTASPYQTFVGTGLHSSSPPRASASQASLPTSVSPNSSSTLSYYNGFKRLRTTPTSCLTEWPSGLSFYLHDSILPPYTYSHHAIT